jgi:hypothetical protein
MYIMQVEKDSVRFPGCTVCLTRAMFYFVAYNNILKFLRVLFSVWLLRNREKRENEISEL